MWHVKREWTGPGYDDRLIEVSLRMIGHQMLLRSNDSVSRVLPITKTDNTYILKFESELGFIPDDLVATVTQVMQGMEKIPGYIMEVEHCGTGEIVYSFKVDTQEKSDIIPCRERTLPIACYVFLMTLIEPNTDLGTGPSKATDSRMESIFGMHKMPYMLGALLVLLVGGFMVLRNGKDTNAHDHNTIALGDYTFDKRSAKLLIGNHKIELSGKEADLLILLYNEVNTTVERDSILHTVWGDEGVYVGRTLDVFISKLRKKLRFDPNIKIVSTRGVGYRLVITD